MSCSSPWRRVRALVAAAAVLSSLSLNLQSPAHADPGPRIQVPGREHATMKAAPGIEVSGNEIVTTSAGRLGVHMVGAGGKPWSCVA